jgi:hypothetical protein
LLFFLFVAAIYGQTKKIIFSGVVNNDIRKIIDMPVDNIKPLVALDESPKKKSPFLAGVFSAILPGSGEFYSEQYIKSAVFLGIEAAAIIVGLINDKKGDDKTNEFQSYANMNWSAARYARWTLVHTRAINPDVDPSTFNVFNSNGQVVWSELNRLENAIGQGTNYYSHRLAGYGEQQYYEMIGKYPQFNPGWDDFGDENTAYKYGDPVTAHFTYYSGERGKANDFYNIASKAVVVIVTNHVISIFDAVWSAASFNKKLQLNMSLKQDQAGYRMVYSTVLNLKYNF